MFNLSIDRDEAELLRHVLLSQLAMLRAELAHSDTLEFKEHLRDRYEKIENLVRRVPASIGYEVEHETPPIL
jgi:hypothetical protein